MSKEALNRLYVEYELSKDDVFKHKHYNIINRKGIEKIQAKAKIKIEYEIIKSTPNFASLKAIGKYNNLVIQTFGSAKKGGKKQIDGKWVSLGNTDSWYVLEIAEKRAASRVILKLTGFYELGFYGEDESDDFKKINNKTIEEKEKELQNILSTKKLDIEDRLNIGRILDQKEVLSYDKIIKKFK